MLQITIPFTNEVVLNTNHVTNKKLDDVIVNRFDEVRGTIYISVKSYHIENIGVYIIKLKCPESVLISARMDQPAWIMNFTLNGHLSIHGDNTGVGLKLKADMHSSFICTSNNATEVVIQGEVELLAVCVNLDVVKKLLNEEEKSVLHSKINNSTNLATNRIITPAMHDILNAVVRCAENNCLHRIFLAAKMLELLFLDVEQLNKLEEPGSPTLRIEDLEKLKLAKEFIGQDIQAPCSLIELAHKVGLNDFKLKKGFKEAFGTTVFGYLSDLRMEQAREMLLKSALSVSEVAHNVGYKNAHHFTAAFKKKFGYLPSDLKYK